MSFQMSTATALPAEVQLGREKPQGAFALRSRYSLSANSASSWNAGTTLTLPLQTGTPGTFTDVKQGIIQATIQIANTNPYVDFLNFGPSGALIFFDEMRVFSSGTPVEENLRYSETADLLMIQGGHQCRPFHVYRRNKWRANNGRAGQFHLNFIKPSMVDSLGVPMFGQTPFMDKNSAVYQPPSISFGAAKGGATFGGYEAYGARTTYAGNATSGGFGQMLGQDGDANFYDGNTSATGNLRCPSLTAAAGDAAATQVAAAYLTGVNGTSSSDCHRNPSHVANNPGDYINVGDLFAYKNTQYARTAPSVADLTAYPWLPAATYTPSQWPDFQPATLCGEIDDEEIDSILGKAKISEYMKYLCNVRSLPIGVKGNTNPLGYQEETTALSIGQATPENAATATQYRVSMPFLSGIYGIFADKMFPDMLIGANNMRIEFKLAQNVKALWTTMDPCRRVQGTMRDFIPFTGSASGAQRGVGAITAVVPITSASAANSAIGCSNALVNLKLNDQGVYKVGTTQWANCVFNSSMYTTASAMGEDIVSPSYSSVAATLTTTSVQVGNALNGNINSTVATSGAAGTYAGATGFHAANKSGLPKPQYVPCNSPWLKAVTALKTYITEAQSCYGTYLPASEPQSRRCWNNTRSKMLGVGAGGDNYLNAGTTSFAIRDIQYIGEQVQLDDVVTSAIIQSAASSEIVVWTRGYRSFEASCDQNSQQNIILPIQIGQAEALYLVFRPSVITTSPDYYSNSFCCPFTGLSFIEGVASANALPSDVGGTYTLQSSMDTSSSGQFSYQLFSGTKQYPLQPIQTVSEMITEREKSCHSLHNWDWCSTENMQLTKWAKKFGAPSDSTGLDFNPFQDFGYFTTFVSIFALDDQTITQNPYLSIAEGTDEVTGGGKTRVRGVRQIPGVSTSSQGSTSFTGVLNKFMPPIGSFYLGWDFESWTNHQDVMRTGKFLGQEQLSIRMTGTYLCTATNIAAVSQVPQAQTVMCTAIVPHVVKMSFVPGGHMLTYY